MKRGVVDSVDKISSNGYKKQKIIPGSEPTSTLMDIKPIDNATKNGMIFSGSDSGTTVTPRSDTMSTDEGEEYNRSDATSVDDADDYKTCATSNNSSSGKVLSTNSIKMNKSIGTMFLKVDIDEKRRFNLTENKNKDGSVIHIYSTWPSICLDLYTINYLKESYFERNTQLNNICNYSIPLSFYSLPSDYNISLYTRMYKQLPLRHCIRLSVFRWMASIIKTRTKLNFDIANPDASCSSKTVSDEELKRNICVKWAIEIKLFLDRILDNVPKTIHGNDDVSHRIMESIDKLKISHSVKTRFKFSDFGKKILQNDRKSFQPVVPHSLIANIQCTLTCGNLFCQKQTKRSAKKPVYTHELEKSQSTDTLGNFPYDLTELKSLRHIIICHLAGWPEGSAMFGLHQIFGTNENKIFQNVISTILTFIDKLVDCYSKNILFETNIGREEGMLDEEHDEDVHGDVDDDLYDWMNNIFTSEDEDEGSIEGVELKNLACEEEGFEVLQKQKINASVLKASNLSDNNNNIIQNLNRNLGENMENNDMKSSGKKAGLRQSSNGLSFLNHIHRVNKKIENKHKARSCDTDEFGLSMISNKKNLKNNAIKQMMPNKETISEKKHSVGAPGKLITKVDHGGLHGKERKNEVAKKSTTTTMEFFDIEMQRYQSDQTELLVFPEEEKHFFFSCFYPDATVCDFFYVFCSCFWPCVILDIRQKLYGHNKQWFSCTMFNFLLFICRWVIFTVFAFLFVSPVIAPLVHRGKHDKRDHVSPDEESGVEKRIPRLRDIILYILVPLGCLISASMLTIYRAKYKFKRGEKNTSCWKSFCASLICTTCTISQMYYDTRDW